MSLSDSVVETCRYVLFCPKIGLFLRYNYLNEGFFAYDDTEWTKGIVFMCHAPVCSLCRSFSA